MLKIISALGFGILLSTGLYAQDSRNHQSHDSFIPELTQYLNTALNEEVDALHGPGVAVSVIHGNRVVIRNRKGVTNLEKKKLLGAHTPFYLASVAKPMTAELILELAKGGQIKLDENIGNILPSLPAYLRKVSVLNLLNHSSGIPDYYRHITWREPVIDNAFVLSLLSEKHDSLLFEPGMKFNYSNSNYILLAEIAEELSGKPFPDLMRQKLLHRYDMHESFVYTGTKPLGSAATGYRYSEGAFLINDYTRIEFRKGVVGSYNMKTYGAGGLFSTQSDLEKWVLNLRKTIRSRENEHQGISVPDENYPEVESVSYRAGWYSGLINHVPIYWHSGEFAGYRALIMYLPQKEIGVVMASNNGNFPAESFGMQLAHWISEYPMIP